MLCFWNCFTLVFQIKSTVCKYKCILHYTCNIVQHVLENTKSSWVINDFEPLLTHWNLIKLNTAVVRLMLTLASCSAFVRIKPGQSYSCSWTTRLHGHGAALWKQLFTSAPTDCFIPGHLIIPLASFWDLSEVMSLTALARCVTNQRPLHHAIQMTLILDLENTNESPVFDFIMQMCRVFFLPVLSTCKELCFLPAKYKNSRASGEDWWTTATASWGHPQSPWYHDLICVCGWFFIAVRTFCRQWCLARKRLLVPVERRNANPGWMQTIYLFISLLVRFFGKFKWHLWYRLVKLQWESICRSAGTSLTISGFLWNVLIAANSFFFFYSL